jgi:regulator of RNase E activity RraA
MNNPAAIRLFTNVKWPDHSLIEQFAAVPTGNVCDAMDRFGALDYQIQALDRKSRMCGAALTVRTRPGDNLAIYQALEVARPGDVMVISVYDHTVCSVVGDLVVNIAKRRGLAGIVTDGLVRDADGIREIGLPVFARGTSPSSPFKDGPGEINAPISCGGVAIHPGDLIVGDGDGVVVVPQRDLEVVAERLKAVIRKEEQMLAAIESGKLTNETMMERLRERGVEIIE